MIVDGLKAFLDSLMSALMSSMESYGVLLAEEKEGLGPAAMYDLLE